MQLLQQVETAVICRDETTANAAAATGRNSCYLLTK